MTASGCFLPATFWRAFFVLLLESWSRAAAPSGPPPELSQLGRPSVAEAKQILEQFQRSGIPGQYFLEIELHALPRRGATVVYRGRMWGGRNEIGAISRVELTDGKGKIHRLLIQNGPRPAVWRLAGTKPERVSIAASFEPVIPGVELTAFDLQMPFLYWPDGQYEKLTRSFRGRPADVFIFKAPTEFARPVLKVTGARVYLDSQYNALMQTELLGDNAVLKTMSLIDLKKIVDPVSKDDAWIPKSLEWRNETTRDKTRLLVKAAALKQQFAPVLFTPEALSETIASPAAAHLVRLER